MSDKDFVSFVKKGIKEELKIQDCDAIKEGLSDEFSCLPWISKKDGETGFIILRRFSNITDTDDVLGSVVCKLYPKPKSKRVKNRGELEQYFHECKKNNYFITWASDPKKLRFGFVCLTGSSSIWYNCVMRKNEWTDIFIKEDKKYK